jgi:putative peptidoglycan lipid II flippase
VLASLLAVGAVSALAYAQVLYLLPISLFGMAVAAAELPELSRLRDAGRRAISARVSEGMARIAFYVAPTMALYIAAGDVVVRALLERGEFSAQDTRVVWFTIGAFALGLLGTTRARLLQNGLYALDRPRLVARIAVVRVVLAAAVGALLMFPLDRWAVVGSHLERDAPVGAPHLGVVGLALGAAIASWVEYRVLRSALEWRVGQLAIGTDTRFSVVAAAGVGVLAAGLRAVSDGLPSWASVAVVVGPTAVAYLAITSAYGVSEARALLRRARRLAREIGGRQVG